MNLFQTLMALVVLIFVLSVIVQAAQEGLKSVLGMKAGTMAEAVKKFMGDHLTLQQVEGALQVRGLDLTALDHFNKDDFRQLLNGIQLAAPQVQGVVAASNATIDDAKNNIAAAYDGLRAAFQKTYTRKNKTFAVIISFVVVLVLNASLVKIYETLAADQALSQKIAGTAANVTSASNSGQDLSGVYDQVRAELKTYPILLRTGRYEDDFKEGVLDEIAGLVLMGLLVSLGAPFWNDVLKGMTGVNNVLNMNKKTS